MRVILYTGKGGVGKTSLAAAAAIATAKEGKKTIIISTDAAHSLGDVFDLTFNSEITKVQENLWAQEVSSLTSTEKHWGKVQKYLSSLMLSQNIKDITTEELLVFPGLEELFCLLEILAHCQGGNYDIVIVDCAPTGETLRLLSFPEILKWWLEKILPMEKLLLKIVRPIAKPLINAPLPPDDMLDSMGELVIKVQEMNEMLTDQRITTVRLVVNPEKMVIKEAQRSFTYLNLYGFNVDAVIVNRLLPDVDLGSYFKKWSEMHIAYLEQIKEQFYPVPIFSVPLFAEEILGSLALQRMATACFGDVSPAEILYSGQSQKISPTDNGYLLELALPFVSKESVALSQQGEELTVRVGNYKRNIYLPRNLQGRSAYAASMKDGLLKIEFGGRESDPT